MSAVAGIAKILEITVGIVLALAKIWLAAQIRKMSFISIVRRKNVTPKKRVARLFKIRRVATMFILKKYLIIIIALLQIPILFAKILPNPVALKKRAAIFISRREAAQICRPWLKKRMFVQPLALVMKVSLMLQIQAWPILFLLRPRPVGLRMLAAKNTPTLTK